MSLQESGITETVNNMNHLQPSWEDDTDDFLKSMLNGPDLSSQLESVCPSDTSSDSGCPDDRVRTLASPGLDDDRYDHGCLDLVSSPPVSPSSNVDLVDFISNDETVDTMEQVNSLSHNTGTTTIILPIVQSQHSPIPVSV